jgi:hypothetical protein
VVEILLVMEADRIEFLQVLGAGYSRNLCNNVVHAERWCVSYRM